MFMIAISLFDGRNEVVLPADSIIKMVDKRAEYYTVYKGYSYFYTPNEDETSNDWCYSINGKRYSKTGTSDYKELEKFYENTHVKPYQMNLFE